MVHGLAEMPPPQPDDRRAAPASRDVLRSLGVEALLDIIEGSSYGVCVTGDDHTWVYLNPAGADLMGLSFEDAYGRDYLESFPPHEREALLALEGEQREGDTAFYTNTVVRPDGTEREMTWSGTVVRTPLGEVAPAIFHDTSPIRRAQRAAAALAQAAADLAGGGDARAVVDALARAAVATTRAVACLVLVAGDAVTGDGTGRLELAGADDDVTAPPVDAALRHAGWGLGDLPGGSHLTHSRPVLLGDHRSQLLRDPAGAGLVEALGAVAWRGSALVPVRCDGRLVGALVTLLPPEVRSPAEDETELWASLADQVSAALTRQRLRARAGAAAAADERLRIGRDLHDSVSQDLFVIRQRAELLERALTLGDERLLRAAATGLRETSQRAIGDLRALLTELRPAAGTDLGGTLRDHARRVTAEHGLPIDVRVDEGATPWVARLDAAAHEHLLRVAGEALHNAVKHAGASRVVVTVTTTDGDLLVRVRDDGRGTTSTARGSGHGLRTMHERMQLLGGTLSVAGAAGAGTEVVARLPLARITGA